MERVILDVDTGLDDAVALFLAAGLDTLQIEAIIATNGNVGLEKTLENTLNIAETAGLYCPVYKGAAKPLVREPVAAGNFHGESGLDGPVFPPRQRQEVQEESGIDAIIRLVHTYPHEITIISVGPLTDLALAMQKDSEVAHIAKQIIIMGGSFSAGNVTDFAEFNIYADPEAAQIVFSSGANLVLFPLDCTRQVTLSPSRLEGYHTIKTNSAQVFAACMDTYQANYARQKQGWPQMHDPLCVAYLGDPEKVQTEYKRVWVVIEKGPTYGKTVKEETKNNDGVHIATSIDIPWFWSLVDKALAVLP
ncbi:MAG: nucleoside hydrolase [Spirochaetaceae bacterium]|nr:nucleoside hydrolase [Spirochaetaceae bacterium]